MVVGTVPGEPDIAQVVHEDAVLAGRPFVALALVAVRIAPTVEQVAVGVELENRRRRVAALGQRRVLRQARLVGVEAAGALDEPDMVVHVHRDPGDFPDQPVVGEDRPVGIHLGHFRMLEVRVVHRRSARPFARCLAADGERHSQNHQEKNRILGLHRCLPESLPRRKSVIGARTAPNRVSVWEPRPTAKPSGAIATPERRPSAGARRRPGLREALRVRSGSRDDQWVWPEWSTTNFCARRPVLTSAV